MQLVPTFLFLATLAAATPATPATPAVDTADTNSSVGKALYMTAPACSFYQCSVDWYQGSTVNVNWLASPAGKVSVTLISHNGGTDYVITPSSNGVTTTCDAGAGVGVAVSGTTCGNAEFVVPTGWEIRSNYSIQVSSISEPTISGYTDLVSILAANASSPAAPSGTTVSLIGIVSSTSAASQIVTPAGSATTTPESTSAQTTKVPTTASGSMTAAPTSAGATAAASISTTATNSAGTRIAAGYCRQGSLIGAAGLALWFTI